MFVEKETTLVYLSPHLDDAVFSCGGLLWEQIQKGYKVEVWTFSTMEPEPYLLSPYAKMLHSRWKEVEYPYHVRKEEDKNALSLLGCNWEHLNFPDCIYRFDNVTGQPLIQKDDDLFPENYQPDWSFIGDMTSTLKGALFLRDDAAFQTGAPSNKFQLIAPLGVGGHIDHRNTLLAAEQLELPLFYYAEYPYAAKDPIKVSAMLPPKSRAFPFEISSAGLAAWQEAVGCYGSQISSFWSSMDEMKSALADYAYLPIARTLWKSHFTFGRAHGETRFIN